MRTDIREETDKEREEREAEEHEAEIRSKAENNVSALCAYYICEFCDRHESTSEEMIEHLIECHEEELE